MKPETLRVRLEPGVGAPRRVIAQQRSNLTKAKASRDAGNHIFGFIREGWFQSFLLDFIQDWKMKSK
jgi:hypothetical protein